MPPKRKNAPLRVKVKPKVKVRLPAKPSAPKKPPQTRKKVDAKIARLVRCVLDPFAGPLSTALIPGGPPNVAVARRQSTFMLTIDGSAAGTDMAVVWNGARDPYIVTATGGTDWTAPTVRAFGRAADLAANYTVPLSSLMRVVSAGVRVECTSNITDIAGMIYQFPYDNDYAGSGVQLAPTWGSIIAELDHSVAHQRLGPRRMSMICPPEEDFMPVRSLPDTGWQTGLPDATTQAVISRFFVMGVPQGKTLSFLVTLSEVVEYFHVLDKHFSQPAPTHVHGPAIVGSLRTALTAPNSQATVSGTPEQSKRVSNALSSALGEVLTIGKTLVENKQTISDAASILQDGLAFLLG